MVNFKIRVTRERCNVHLVKNVRQICPVRDSSFLCVPCSPHDGHYNVCLVQDWFLFENSAAFKLV